MSQQSSDSGRTSVLDLSPLTRLEAAALLEKLRNAQLDIEDANWIIGYPVWREIIDLRMEVREVFLRKFFEVDR